MRKVIQRTLLLPRDNNVVTCLNTHPFDDKRKGHKSKVVHFINFFLFLTQALSFASTYPKWTWIFMSRTENLQTHKYCFVYQTHFSNFATYFWCWQGFFENMVLPALWTEILKTTLAKKVYFAFNEDISKLLLFVLLYCIFDTYISLNHQN